MFDFCSQDGSGQDLSTLELLTSVDLGSILLQTFSFI